MRARIMTGATMPAGLDTIVPQEFVRARRRSRIVLAARRRAPGREPAPGRRRPGARRDRALRPAGCCARPTSACWRSLGRAEVPVFRRLRVAFFSDRRRAALDRRAARPPGSVYDSNRYTLWAMLQRLGVEVLDLGVVRDDPTALRSRLPQPRRTQPTRSSPPAARSVGEADHTRRWCSPASATCVFWRIAMRPGRPMAIGRIESAGRSVIAFGLPGNPVAVMVTFYASRARRAAGDERRSADALARCCARQRRRGAQEAGPHRIPARRSSSAPPTAACRCR